MPSLGDVPWRSPDTVRSANFHPPRLLAYHFANMSFISYAQNFEDVMLWRALKHVERGFYIDVGAYSPQVDSVTQAFYDRGWRGINVEPHPEYFQQFVSARPRDVNLNVALGERAGDATMNFVDGTGLSTLSDIQAEERLREGRTVDRVTVHVETVASIWSAHVPADQPVHFLKVDVEGFERQVLMGNDWAAYRPWLVLVEATEPLTMNPSHQDWEVLLTSSEYAFVYGDGLNRFYVASEHEDLAGTFDFPPNVFDEMVRASEFDAMERAIRAESDLAWIKATRSWRWTQPIRTSLGVGRRVRAAIRRAPRQRSERSTLADTDLPGPTESGAELRTEAVGRRLLVDVSFLVRVDAGSGIQRVVRNLLASLPSQLPVEFRLEPVFATSDRPGYRHARRSETPAGPSSLTPTDATLVPRHGDVFLGLDLEQDVVFAQSAFYGELRRSGIPVYFVVYDLLPVLMPHRFPPGTEERHRRWLRVVCSADGALCISMAVANELRSWARTSGPAPHGHLRISWFHLGADIDRAEQTRGLPPDAASTLDQLAVRPTFLLVGTIESRKGHLQTLEGFERLWETQTDANLVFVGRRGWQMDEFVVKLRRHPEAGRRLFWMQRVSDEYLAQIYRASSCLIAPSEGEGFGLPLIEAAQHGTPILARDIPVFREVAGEHALYFSGVDPASLADAVRSWLMLSNEGRHPRPDGMSWLTWEGSAAQVVDILCGSQRAPTDAMGERSDATGVS